AAALALVEVVDEVLVVGEGVDGLDMAVVHTPLVVDDLQHRGDAVGGAGRGGEDAVVLGVQVDVGVVDAEDEVLDVALARCGEQCAGNALGLQVLAQPLAVTPHAGVVDDDGVIDAVLGVVDLGRLVGIDDLDRGAVGPDDVVLLVDPDGAVEAAVDGVAAQQGGTLLQVVLGVLADDDGAQARAGLLGALGEQDASQEAADAA